MQVEMEILNSFRDNRTTMKSNPKDTRRLTWLLKYITEHGWDGLEKLIWTVAVEHDEGHDDDLDFRFDRRTIDRAMKLAKFVQENTDMGDYSSSAGYGGWGHDE